MRVHSDAHAPAASLALTLTASLIGTSAAVATDTPPSAPQTIEFTYDTQENTDAVVDRALAESGLALPSETVTKVKAKFNFVRTRPRLWATTTSPLETDGGVETKVSVTTYRNARIWGTPANNNRSWIAPSVLEHVVCNIGGIIGCSPTDRYTTHITIDPGNTASRITAKSTYFPNTGKINPPAFYFEGWRNNSSMNGTGALTANVGASYVTAYIQHELPPKGNQFGYYITGTYVGNGTLYALNPGRTNSGSCTSASVPTCTFW
ncbi:hypothetical protein [Cellulomonas septica]|uniref:Uncharacterized protein n=1 Tax=Cellulomonas septica TaxID=285080 RepID=A0ABX1K3Y1_9CELL|nr:hypothetical protein [Cellulomonas septica]NKY39693.1 hypothetical protein [Cellulomonas septica]